MLILGLTGNIGCGKSTLSNIFIKNNISVIDADIISREIMNDKETLNQIQNTFGNEVIKEDNTLDRKKLASIVFSKDSELIKLNNITHPIIKNKIRINIDNLKKQNKEIVVIDGALLIEANYIDLLDKLIVIKCSEEIQIDRIIKRDNCTINEAISRIKSQMSQTEKISYADYVIDNSSDEDKLKIESQILIAHIKEKWCV